MRSNKSMYTVVLPVNNEEARIELALRNFYGRCPILVLDNFSADNSIAVARRYTDCILQFKNPGYLSPECYALIFKNIATEYLLIAFAGQYYPRELLDCYGEVARARRYKAVATYMRTYSYGVPVNTYSKLYRNKGGAFSFFDKNSIDLSRSKIHEELPFSGRRDEILFPPKKKEYCITTFRDDTAAVTEEKHTRYANFDASQRFEKGERTSVLKMVLLSLKELCVCLLWRGALWQGRAGLVNSIYRAFYFFSIQVRLWEMQDGLTYERVRLLHLRIRDQLLTLSLKKEQSKGAASSIYDT